MAAAKPNIDVLELETIPTGPVKALDEKDKKMACLLVALGDGETTVADKMGITVQEVMKLTRDEQGIEWVLRYQCATYTEPLTRVKKMASMALDRMTRILLTGKDSDAIKVAVDVMDRATGKPTQVVENRNLNIDLKDMQSADRALKAQEAKLKDLEEKRQKLQDAALGLRGPYYNQPAA